MTPGSDDRVIVVGAGVVGLCIAFFLHQAGRRVTVLDARRPGGGASERNAGWITLGLGEPLPAPNLRGRAAIWALQPRSPLYIKPRLDWGFARWLIAFWRNCTPDAFDRGIEGIAGLNRTTFQMLAQLQEAGVNLTAGSNGLLLAFRRAASRDGILEDLGRIGRHLPLEVTALDQTETEALEPALKGSVQGGVLIAEERLARPEHVVSALVEWLTARDVEIRSDAPVQRVDVERGRATGVSIRGERLAASSVVLAAGVWTRELARSLGMDLPIESGKGYTVDFAPPPIQLQRPIYLHEARIAVSPFPGMLRLAGTMELSGLNERLVRSRADAIVRAASRYFRGWPGDLPAGERWCGLRPLSPDGLPLIGRLPGAEGVFIATGHAMLGLTLAPATGASLARLIVTGAVPRELEPFDPARFARRSP
jgi:D-amino-acid dehydrogenase